jgi:hypothetical protein
VAITKSLAASAAAISAFMKRSWDMELRVRSVLVSAVPGQGFFYLPDTIHKSIRGNKVLFTAGALDLMTCFNIEDMYPKRIPAL